MARVRQTIATGDIELSLLEMSRHTPKGDQDRSDVRRLIQGGRTSARAIQSILRKHRPDLLPVLEEMLGRGKA